jgi:hypothetical protein
VVRRICPTRTSAARTSAMPPPIKTRYGQTDSIGGTPVSDSRPTARAPPLWGVMPPRRVVRFARLIHRRIRALGGPTVRADYDDSLSRPWLLRG